MNEDTKGEEQNVVPIYKKHHIRRRKLKRRLFFFFSGVLLMAAILFSPLFSISTIEVEGLHQFEKEKICEMADLKEGSNLFWFLLSGAESKLTKSAYIDQCKISFSLPGKVRLTIKERYVCGYVPYMNRYLCIDEYGRVLESVEKCEKNLPIVTGLIFSEFRVGEKLQVENPESFDIVVTVAQLISKYELLGNILQLNVSDPERITARVKQVDVILGTIDNIDEKIRTMSSVMEQIPDTDRGTLNLTNLSGPIIFKYLT